MIPGLPPRGKKTLQIIAGILGLVIVFEFSLVLFRPAPAKAFPGEAMAAAVWKEIKDSFRFLKNNIRDKINKAMKISADVAFKNALRVFAGKLAEDTATWIASAGTGQKPLFITDRKYFSNLADAAAGDFIDQYAKDIFGSSICEPNAPKTYQLLKITESLTFENPIKSCQQRCEQESLDRQKRLGEIETNRQKADAQASKDPNATIKCNVKLPSNQPPLPENYEYGGPGINLTAGECLTTLNAILVKERARDTQELKHCIELCTSGRRKSSCQVTTVWKNLKASEVSAQASLYFGVEENDIGQILSLSGKAGQEQQKAVAEEKTILGSGTLKPPQTKVTKESKAPPELVEKQAGKAIDESTTAEKTYTGSVAADVIRIFTNTLTQKLMERFFKGKCGLNPDACKGPTQARSQLGASLIASGSNLAGVAAAKLQFASLGQTDYVTGDASRTEDIFEIMRGRGVLVDEKLVQAVNEKKTVKEALDQGLLDGTKTFGFDATGSEPQDGYPYRLILYLRHYRVVPVGWELAAQYILQFDKRDIGLKELLDLSGKPKLIKADGTEENNPYYKLIDPNWVLKAPSTYCKRQGAGEEIVNRTFVCDEDNDLIATTGYPNSNGETGDGKVNCSPYNPNNPDPPQDIGRWQLTRNTDYCTDEQSCIAENDDGTCKQYGYCYAEKRIWRFDGTSCPDYFASCTAYQSDEGLEVAYLANTTNGVGCSADNAGCRWYCTDPVPNTSDQWTCTVALPDNKIRFDNDAQTCPETAEGCTQFLRTTNSSNLAANGSFEYFTGTLDDGVADAFAIWNDGNISGEAVTSDNTLIADFPNKVAIIPSANLSLTYAVPPSSIQASLDYRTFTASYYAKAGGACAGNVTLTVNGVQTTVAMNYDANWQRYSLTAPAAQPPTIDPRVIIEIAAGCGGLTIDNVQLEEGQSATDFKDYAGSNLVYLNKNRLQCRPEEVGCELYTPLAGGSKTPGVVRDNNRCPATEVGCKAFEETPITRIPQRPPPAAANPLYLIPATGTQCSASSVGCEEYTDMDAQARGGESRVYYSFIKQCVRPDPNSPDQITYFTWEGSETQGYQLKSYRMLKSNGGDDGPCTNLTVADINTPPQCNDNNEPVASCLQGDMATNPDCTEFFNTAGDVFYRLRSRTIRVTDSCFPARNTIDQTLGPPESDKIYMISGDESISCSASHAGCREYKGNAGNNVRTVFRDDFEQVQVVNWAPQNRSTESIAVGGHSLKANGAFVLLSAALKPLVSEGKLYTVSFWAKASNIPAEISSIFITDGVTPLTFPGTPLALQTEWNRYSAGPLNFSRPVGASEVMVLVLAGGDVFLDNFELKEITDSVYLVKDSARACLAINANCEAYTDRSGNLNYLTSFTSLCAEDKVGCEELVNTQNSTTPDELTVKGVTVGKDRNETWVVSSSAQCTADNKGCQRLGLPTIDVNQNITDWKSLWLKNNPDEYERTLCLQEEEGCLGYTSKVDKAKVYFRDPGDYTCSYERPTTVKRCDDKVTVCGSDADCAGIGNGTCTVQPNSGFARLCPDGVGACKVDFDCTGIGDETCAVRPFDNFIWVLTGTALPCPSTKMIDPCEFRDDVQKFCYRSSPDLQCRECVTRLCEASQSGCNAYRDPSDPENCRFDCPLELTQGKPEPVDARCRPKPENQGGIPGCSSYYYLKQSVEGSVAECSSQVNLEEGCRPFLDTSNPERNFRGS